MYSDCIQALSDAKTVWDGAMRYNAIDVELRPQLEAWCEEPVQIGNAAEAIALSQDINGIREKINQAQTDRKRDPEKVAAMVAVYCCAIDRLQYCVIAAKADALERVDPRVLEFAACATDQDFLQALIDTSVTTDNDDVKVLLEDCFKNESCRAAIATLFGVESTVETIHESFVRASTQAAKNTPSPQPAGTPSPPPPKRSMKRARKSTSAFPLLN